MEPEMQFMVKRKEGVWFLECDKAPKLFVAGHTLIEVLENAAKLIQDTAVEISIAQMCGKECEGMFKARATKGRAAA